MVFDKKGACDMLAAGFVCYCSSVRIDHSKLDRNICFAFNRQFPMFLVNQQHAIRPFGDEDDNRTTGWMIQKKNVTRTGVGMNLVTGQWGCPNGSPPPPTF